MRSSAAVARYTLTGLAGVFLIFALFTNSITETAWQRFRLSQPALYLPHQNAPLLLEIGNYHFGLAVYDLSLAERAYRRALVIEPAILWGHYQLARVLFMRGEHDVALAEINRELAANPENLRALYVRGLIQANRNDLAAAEEDFRNFTLWAPREWAGYNDLAWMLSKRGKHRDAKAAIQNAFIEVPDAASNPWLWNALGVAELNLGNRREAAAAFQRTQELAGGLGEAEWRAAYPGNNPADAVGGLTAFRAAIAENIRRSR